MADKIFKPDMETLAEDCSPRFKTPESIGALQVTIYTMCGGGFLGRFAAEQPASFYIDDRVGKLPYPKKAIYQAVAVLKKLAMATGMDLSHMPEMPSFHCCGVF